MYTEEYEAKGFPLRSFLLRLIFVIIFVFLLIWLIPKVTSQKVVDKSNKINSPLGNRIFAENIEKMKSVAIDYYKKERLPKDVNDKRVLTLENMVHKKLIVPLIDQKDRACDMKKSYAKVTKINEEYLMKINLKCSKEEDYVLVHLGAYPYCDIDICEKKAPEIKNGKTKPGKRSI